MPDAPRRPSHALATSAAVVLIGLGATLAASCGSGDDSGAGAPSGASSTVATVGELSVVDFAFDPATAVVAAGSTVRLVNGDPSRHTVTSGPSDDPGAVFDVALAPDGTGELVIDEPGTYPYFCRIHPGMEGTITALG